MSTANALNIGLTSSGLIYADSATSVACLTPVSNGVLVTDGSGIPSISATLPAPVQANITQTGSITSGIWQASTIGINKGGTGSVTAPAALAALGALPLAGGTMTGDLVLNAAPTLPLGAVTKTYVDNLVTGLSWKISVVVATVSDITLAGEQTINGVAVVATNRVLVRAQTDQTENGYWAAAVGAWTRTTDADTGAEIVGSAVLAVGGTLLGGSQWVNQQTSITLGVTAITFAQVGGAGTYLADGMTLSLIGNTFSINTGYVGQTSITTLGTVSTGVWNGTAIADSYISTPYVKADGTRALTGSWAAGAFSATFNSVVVGSAANTISGLATVVNGAGTLTLPTTTDVLVGRATTDVFTNKSISGSTNTFTNIADSALTTSYIKADGTRALTANWSAGSFSATFNSVIVGSAASTISGLSTVVNGVGQLNINSTGTVTIPNATDTLVGKATTDIFTNKSMSGATNTFTNIPDNAFSTSYIKADGTRALTANWAAGAFSATFNSVIVGSAANTISGLSTVINGAGTLTLPTTTDTLVGKATTDIFTNKTFDTSGTGNSFSIASNAITGVTGSGAVVVLATGAVLVGPTLGAALATSINKVTITAPASSAVLTIANGKTLTVSNTLTFSGTDSSSIAFGAGGTVAYTSNNLSVFAATTSAQLAGVISDGTGSGALVFGTNPVLVGPTLGAALATSINKVTVTAPATAATLTIANNKTLTVSNTLTFSGTDGASLAFGTGGTFAYLTNNLGDFASTTSAQLKSVISDETGSGSLVFATNPALATPTTDSMNVNGTAGAGFIQFNTQSSTPSAGAANSVRIFTDSLGRFCWFPETNQFVRRIDGALTNNRIFVLPDQAGTFTVLGNSTTGSGSIVLDTNAALTTPTATSMNMIGVNGAGFLQLNSQVSGTPATGNSNSTRLFSSSGGLFSYIQQNDGYIRFFGGTFSANRTITFQNVSGTVYVTGGTNVAIADGGTGAGTAAAARVNLGILLNSPRAYVDATSIGFGVARTPSTTQDTTVVVVVAITESNSNQGSASAVINGTTTIAKTLLNHSTSAIGTIKTEETMTFVCPANSSYTITNAGGGTVSLSSIYELTM